MITGGGARTSWRRSLYWRIAIGFNLLIAIVVIVQAAALVWLMERAETLAARPLDGTYVTQIVARHLGDAWSADPDLDVTRFLRDANPTGRLFVITADGRVEGVHPGEAIVRTVTGTLSHFSGPGVPVSWERSIYRAAPVMVDGRVIATLGETPATRLQRYGPQVASLVLVVMVGGTILTYGLIFGPVRRRMGDLAQAARRLGGGDFSARANQDGADEVSELAAAFNLMADELVTRATRVEESDKARRQLLADVSHELKTPVTTIRGYLETLAMPEVNLDVQTRARHITVARRETNRLERLIGDLLDTAGLEAGGVELDIEDVSVADLFERVAGRHEYECRARNITLVPSILPGAEALVGDTFRLEQALANVTANALRHSSDGGTIELRAEPANGVIVLSVTDHGEGIAPQHLPLIFDRFYKARSPLSASSGSGLGLSIVKAIVGRHGGRVSASSEVGRGTTITLELPMPADEHNGSGRAPHEASADPAA